jgi:hypothetical protein
MSTHLKSPLTYRKYSRMIQRDTALVRNPERAARGAKLGSPNESETFVVAFEYRELSRVTESVTEGLTS